MVGRVRPDLAGHSNILLHIVGFGLVTRIFRGDFGLLKEEVDTFGLLFLTHEDGIEATGLLDGFQHLIVQKVAVGRVFTALVLHEEISRILVGIRILSCSHWRKLIVAVVILLVCN